MKKKAKKKITTERKTAHTTEHRTHLQAINNNEKLTAKQK